MWHIIWNGFLILTPTDNKISGPSCCDYAFHKFLKKRKERKEEGIDGRHFNMNKCSICWYEILSGDTPNDGSAFSSGSVRPVRTTHAEPGRSLIVTWLGSVVKREGGEEEEEEEEEGGGGGGGEEEEEEGGGGGRGEEEEEKMRRRGRRRRRRKRKRRRAEMAPAKDPVLLALCLVNKGSLAASNAVRLVHFWWNESAARRSIAPPPTPETTLAGGLIRSPLPIGGKRSLHLPLDTPLVFEIKVDACNPGKRSLSSRLTRV